MMQNDARQITWIRSALQEIFAEVIAENQVSRGR